MRFFYKTGHNMRFSLTTTLGLSLVLLCGLANADMPTSFEINHTVNGTSTSQNTTIDNYVFGTENFLDGNDNGLRDSFPIVVNSGLGSEGFDFDVVLDYTDLDISFFGVGTVEGSFVGIGHPITGVSVTDIEGGPFGNFSTDGSTIFFDYTIADVLSINEGPVTISFSTQAVPEPSSTVIIGLAGLCLASRRRR